MTRNLPEKIWEQFAITTKIIQRLHLYHQTKPLRPVIMQHVIRLQKEQIQVKIKKRFQFHQETGQKPLRSKSLH